MKFTTFNTVHCSNGVVPTGRIDLLNELVVEVSHNGIALISYGFRLWLTHFDWALCA